jgi:hypothetical protein
LVGLSWIALKEIGITKIAIEYEVLKIDLHSILSKNILNSE